MPSFDGATGWLNSEPLGPAELRGQVVLVNFWTPCAWSAVRGLTMTRPDDWVVVEVAGSEPEAELLCSLLRSAGIECVPQLTNRGSGGR